MFNLNYSKINFVFKHYFVINKTFINFKQIFIFNYLSIIVYFIINYFNILTNYSFYSND
jgi:hypothetical protein